MYVFCELGLLIVCSSTLFSMDMYFRLFQFDVTEFPQTEYVRNVFLKVCRS